nr:MAG TPA: hypothetical protein [Caudoviricetes sp.]
MENSRLSTEKINEMVDKIADSNFTMYNLFSTKMDLPKLTTLEDALLVIDGLSNRLSISKLKASLISLREKLFDISANYRGVKKIKRTVDGNEILYIPILKDVGMYSSIIAVIVSDTKVVVKALIYRKGDLEITVDLFEDSNELDMIVPFLFRELGKQNGIDNLNKFFEAELNKLKNPNEFYSFDAESLKRIQDVFNKVLADFIYNKGEIK